MRRIGMMMLAALLGAPLAGCYTLDQPRLANAVVQLVQPGMPMEQALVRLRAEEFVCNASGGVGAVTVCTRTHARFLRGSCVERVDLMRGASANASVNTVGAVEVMETRCTKGLGW